MPIYEFYCKDCNTIFSFFSTRVNVQKRPICPRCKKVELEKIISRFSVLRGVKEGSDVDIPDIDESKLSKAMSLIEKEGKNLNEEDPRQAAQLMRKICNITGLKLGSGMEEAIRRMESGEDPEKIEEDMGDLFEGEENPFLDSKKVVKKKRVREPERDENLYIL